MALDYGVHCLQVAAEEERVQIAWGRGGRAEGGQGGGCLFGGCHGVFLRFEGQVDGRGVVMERCLAATEQP